MSEVTSEKMKSEISEFISYYRSVNKNLSQVIVGMTNVVDLTLSAIFAGGHVLLEGAPGLGKTLLVRSISQSLGLSFNRIQFTSDLMPSDITGTQVLMEDPDGKRAFKFNPGPLFANIVLADEINRAGPKTQSALLEAMEEKQVSVLGTTYKLPRPYFVLATQNPVELEGTYPLPEAQLDRFMFKILVPSPSGEELKEILRRTTNKTPVKLKSLLTPEQSAKKIVHARKLVKSVLVAPQLEDVVVGIISSLTPDNPACLDLTSQYIRFGPGPRGAQSLVLAAKVFALLDGRANLSTEDIKRALKPSLRHRLILNFQAEAEGVSADDILDKVI